MLTWKSCSYWSSGENLVRNAAQTYRWNDAKPSGSDWQQQQQSNVNYSNTDNCLFLQLHKVNNAQLDLVKRKLEPVQFGKRNFRDNIIY